MKMSIAQLREKELQVLVSYKTNEPTDDDYNEARSIMNSFYRLCGLCETNLNLANDERQHDLKSTKYSEEREEKWFNRLNKQFSSIYGLCLFYGGYCPSIGIRDPESGGYSEKISRYFYD